MTEEVPKNHGFLKFIVIFMGILIVIGLCVIVWKVIDLAKSKAAREKMAVAQQTQSLAPKIVLPEGLPFNVQLPLDSGERILEISPVAQGLWIRIGQNDVTRKIILLNHKGEVTGTVRINRNGQTAPPVQ